MGFDYLNDTFGEYIETSPKYRDVENKAIRLLIRIYKEDITFDEIYDGFEAVRKEVIELDDNTIGEGYPLWMSHILYHFVKWKKWHQLRRYHDERPEEFNTEELQMQYREIENMRYDDMFFDKCNYCFSELGHKISKIRD